MRLRGRCLRKPHDLEGISSQLMDSRTKRFGNPLVKLAATRVITPRRRLQRTAGAESVQDVVNYKGLLFKGESGYL